MYDGSNWTQLIPQSAPPALSQGTMAFDGGTGQTVLFGSGFGGTWAFDGSSWTEFLSTSEPSVRSGAAMSYDAATGQLGQLVVFGGASGSNALNDTWGYSSAEAAAVVTFSESHTSVKFGEENADRVSVSVSGTNGLPTPTGEVAVEDIMGGFPVPICTVTSFLGSGDTATGACTASATALPAGADLTLGVTARYAGDSAYAIATANLARSLKVAKAKSLIALVLSSASLVYGPEQSETLTVSVGSGGRMCEAHFRSTGGALLRRGQRSRPARDLPRLVRRVDDWFFIV
jgi:hypothetical protein